MLYSISLFKLCIDSFVERKNRFFSYTMSLRIMLFQSVIVQWYWSYFTSDARSYFPLWKFSIRIISIFEWIFQYFGNSVTIVTKPIDCAVEGWDPDLNCQNELMVDLNFLFSGSFFNLSSWKYPEKVGLLSSTKML